MDISTLSLYILWNVLIQTCYGETLGIEAITTASPWKKTLCHERRKHLLSLQTEELRKGVNNFIKEENNFSDLYWIGGRRRSSTWAWTRNGTSVDFGIRYRGCIPIPKNIKSYANTTSTVACISYCMTDESNPRTIKYIGLHGNYCYCIKAKDVPLCTKLCGRNNSDSCGGENEFSIYEKRGVHNTDYKESCTNGGNFSSVRKDFTPNSLKKCAAYCNSFNAPITYILLQGEKCICLAKLPKDLTRTHFLDTSYCGVRCNGSDNDRCGGYFHDNEALMSVYEIEDRARWQYGDPNLSDFSMNCVYIQWDSIQDEFSWFNTECSDKKQFICETEEGYKPHTEEMSWHEARKECISEGGDLFKYKMFQDYSKTEKIQDEFWIGLHRYGWMWLDETDVIDSEISQTNFPVSNQCLAVQFSETGYQLIGQNCSLNLSYICYGNALLPRNRMSVHSSVVSRKHFQTTSPPKPLVSVKPNRMGTGIDNELEVFLIAGGTIAGGLILMICFIVVCVIHSRSMDVLKKRRAVYHVLEKHCEDKCDPKTCRCRHCNEQYRSSRENPSLDASVPNGGNLYESVENEQNKHSEIQRQLSTPPVDDSVPYDSLFAKKKGHNNNLKDETENICMQETENETFDHVIVENGQSNDDKTDANVYDRCGDQHTKLNPRVIYPDPTYAHADT